MRLLRRVTAKGIMVIFALSLIVANVNPKLVMADELSDQINSKKQEISAVNKRITELKNQLSQTQKEISSLNAQLASIDSRIELVQLQIQATQMEIEKNTVEIEKTELEIEEKEKEIARQKELINNVIKGLYKEKDTSILAVIIGSSSFSEMITRTEYLTRIRTSLKENMNKMEILKKELEDKKEELDKTKQSLEDLKKQKEEEEVTLEDQKYAKAKIIEMTRGQESEYQSKLAQANAEEQSINAEITRLVQEQARRKRAETVEGRPGRETVVNTGGFICPLAGGCRVSITGGDFMDPAYGMGFPHTGVDFAAGQGTPVMAAGAGTIVIARDSGGPGLSYIAIDHGNGLITKYLHMSAIYVSSGDIVNAGEVIGLSGGAPGTRGAGIFTTGAHLHFEINDYNGNAINPHGYLKIAPPLY